MTPEIENYIFKYVKLFEQQHQRVEEYDKQTTTFLNYFNQDINKIHDWILINKNYQKLDISVIEKYSHMYDEIINYGLRTKNLSGVGYDLTLRLLNIIDKTPPTPKDIILFRGIKDTDKLEFSKMNVGDKFSDAGFMSKTFSYPVAHSFKPYNTYCCIFAIIYPKGSKLIYLSYSSHPEEKELLSYPGEILDVIAKYDNLTYKDAAFTLFILKPIGYTYKYLRQYLPTIVNPKLDTQFIKIYHIIKSSILPTNIISIDVKIPSFNDRSQMIRPITTFVNSSNIIYYYDHIWSYDLLYKYYILNLIKAIYISEIPMELFNIITTHTKKLVLTPKNNATLFFEYTTGNIESVQMTIDTLIKYLASGTLKEILINGENYFPFKSRQPLIEF